MMNFPVWPRRSAVVASGPVPATIADCAEVMAASDERRRMREKRTAILDRMAVLQAALQEDSGAAYDAHLDAAAMAMLADEAAPIAADPAAELALLQTELEVVRRAEQLAVNCYRAVRNTWSQAACHKAAPAHRQAVRLIARRLADLAAACAAEAAVREQMQAAGFDVVEAILPAMSFPSAMLGSPAQYGTPSFTWMETARRRGFLEADEDPATLEP